ncbi:twin-arginine translocase TatA/TatE family subunit [Bartonella tribocorum]|uniref:Sec-independent protein translocase n=1 Tax=Bartonella tribocorum (strain DSM 28219 / CCUG 45778 / CIP 105476 / IBS 506) TaxID=382640 RepID=A9IS15_BART1|nr:twin-arginine translocase TatA/TatE family subunit [Bartonella tribocorum]CAK01249.1 Sec-independent protein translocase [Bartonella tribocorum CIP 105476]CDO48468.1 twin-arginine translocation protein TatB [Bartonella tribocorum]
MFGIDGPELVVILLVLIIVIGPKDLPKILKTIAKLRAYVSSTANELRHQFDDVIKQIERDDLQKTCPDINNSSKKLAETFDPTQNTLEDIYDNWDVKATHHKSKKDKEILECDQKVIKKDRAVSIVSHHSENISVSSKDKEKEDVS